MRVILYEYEDTIINLVLLLVDTFEFYVRQSNKLTPSDKKIIHDHIKSILEVMSTVKG